MDRSQKRNAVLGQKFWFRKDIFSRDCRNDDHVTQMSIDEIINGKVCLCLYCFFIRTFLCLNGIHSYSLNTFQNLNIFLLQVTYDRMQKDFEAKFSLNGAKYRNWKNSVPFFVVTLEVNAP